MQQRIKWAFMTIIVAAIFLGWTLPGAISGVFYPDGATMLHFTFQGSPGGDNPVVRPPSFYHADDGFGFVNSPHLIGTSSGVTAPKYFRFDAKLPPGNYDVTVLMGGVRGESVTTIKAEGHRPMLLDVAAGGRGGTPGNFTVNVRHGAADATALDRDGRLNLEFVGEDPSMLKLDVKPNDTAVTVYLVGDSTVADLEQSGAAGWGQMLPLLFQPGGVAVANHAVAQANPTKFVGDKRFEAIAGTMKAGDYLLVQFGSNAMAKAPLSADSFKNSLKVFVDEARKHEATPVLVTPAPMMSLPTSFADWTRELARDEKIPVIDLNAAGSAFIEKLSPQARAKVFTEQGDLTPYGAYEMAKLVAQGFAEQKLPLAEQLNELITTNPDPQQFPASLGFVDHGDNLSAQMP